MWSWASYLTSLCFYFLTSKMEMIAALTKLFCGLKHWEQCLACRKCQEAMAIIVITMCWWALYWVKKGLTVRLWGEWERDWRDKQEIRINITEQNHCNNCFPGATSFVSPVLLAEDIILPIFWWWNWAPESLGDVNKASLLVRVRARVWIQLRATPQRPGNAPLLRKKPLMHPSPSLPLRICSSERNG